MCRSQTPSSPSGMSSSMLAFNMPNTCTKLHLGLYRFHNIFSLRAKLQLSKTCLHVQGGLAAQPSGNSWGQPGSPGSRPGTAGPYRRSEDPPSTSNLTTFQQTSFNKANSGALSEVSRTWLHQIVCIMAFTCCDPPHQPFLLASEWHHNKPLWKGKTCPTQT